LIYPEGHEKEMLMKRVFKSKSNENGQSMVELALTITILLVLLAGTIDFGRAFFTWLEMRDAAQEGASDASICPTKTNEVIARVHDDLNPIYTYAVSYNPINTALGDSITVTVQTDLPITMPFLGALLNSDHIAIAATINDTILTTSCP